MSRKRPSRSACERGSVPNPHSAAGRESATGEEPAVSKTRFFESLEALSKQWEQRRESLGEIRARAADLARNGQTADALRAYAQVTEATPGDASAWEEKAAVHIAAGQFAEAGEAALHAIRIEPRRTRRHVLFGDIRAALADAGRDRDYLEACGWGGAQRSLEAAADELAGLTSGDESAAMRGINFLAAAGRLEVALQHCEAVASDCKKGWVWTNYADLLQRAGRAGEAARARGLAACYAGEHEAAVVEFAAILREGNADLRAYRAAAECYNQLNRIDEAESALREAARRYGDSLELQVAQLRYLRRAGRAQEVRSLAKALTGKYPCDLLLQLYAHLTLPIVYEDEAEVQAYGDSLKAGLAQVESRLSLASGEEREAALRAIVSWDNFYLSYQGRDIRAEQRRYGEMVHRVMAANYPDFARPRPVPPLGRGGRVRVGYISSHFRFHAVAHAVQGWIAGHDRGRVEVFTYSTGERRDALAARIAKLSDHHRDLAGARIADVCGRVAGDDLHVLVFADIGMWPDTDVIAGLRLAPVQCAAWGHPVTTGLPTMDYFLSAELTEPPGGDAHYTERLVRLPNLGSCYENPGVAARAGSRTEFGIPCDAVVYLSTQSIFKYLPRFDFLYPEIALRVPQARFAFVRHASPGPNEVFQQRLEKAFARQGLDAAKHCLYLPEEGYLQYRRLVATADVFLDTLEWSGFNTTIEAALSGLPIVSRPGAFMRGRQSCAILQRMGIPELIGDSDESVIEIAARLGNDRQWREHMRQLTLARNSRLFDDREPVAFLDTFYQRVIEDPAAAIG